MNYKENLKFYFLNQDFGECRTGVENASLLRARIFKKYLEISPIILTATYNPRLDIQRKKLYEVGLLDQDCPIINLYDYYQETETTVHNQQSEEPMTNDKWTYKPVGNSKDFRVYDKDNNQIMYRACDNNGLLIYNNVYANKKKVRKDTYDTNGFLSRSRFYDPNTGHICLESYYRVDGSVCIYKHFEYVDNKSKLISVHLINKTGEIVETLLSDVDLIAYWILQLMDDNAYNFLMVDKERIYYQSVLKINRANIFKVCMIHSSHIQVGQDIINGGLRSDYRKIIEDLTKQDAVVLLTNRQKEHIEVRFGQHDNLFVIPHSIEKEIPRVDFEKRIPHRAIYLGRYSAEKQQDSLIRSFSKVVQNHADAQLHLYGFGDSEQVEILKKLIKELGLENNVFINDFVDNPGEIYDSASLAVLPSRIEGFSLFLLEGISHGCPVISYDIDYGPKDMIDEGENGYLIEPDNEDEMAQRIIELFSDKEKLIAMSEASYKKAGSFKSEIIAEKWSNLIDKVLQGKLI